MAASGPPPQIIDDGAAGTKYNGVWDAATSPDFYNSTAHCSTDLDATMTYTFRGISVTIIGAVGYTAGGGACYCTSVTLDAMPPASTLLPCNDIPENTLTVYSSPNLDDSEHTLTLSFAKNATGCSTDGIFGSFGEDVCVDSFRVLSAASSSTTSLSSNTPSTTQTRTPGSSTSSVDANTSTITSSSSARISSSNATPSSNPSQSTATSNSSSLSSPQATSASSASGVSFSQSTDPSSSSGTSAATSASLSLDTSVISSPAPSTNTTVVPNTIFAPTVTHKAHTGAIVGGAIGGACLLVILVLAFLYFQRRRAKFEEQVTPDPHPDVGKPGPFLYITPPLDESSAPPPQRKLGPPPANAVSAGTSNSAPEDVEHDAQVPQSNNAIVQIVNLLGPLTEPGGGAARTQLSPNGDGFGGEVDESEIDDLPPVYRPQY